MDGIINVSEMSDSELALFMKNNAISLKLDEARKIVELIGRNPTLTELYIFNIEWSEHCSYKSSRETLKLLPTDASTVILGPKEDAGILRLNDEYGIVISHESHNHPSQVVPYEGAATGIGGNVRDVLCMGAKVIANADPLRFGDPNGKSMNRTKYIANSVIDGIASYGNAIGVPNIAGDVYFNSSFDENCLVNVVTLGLVKNNEIIHSRAPRNSVGYDVILVGKATDNSGFGGAAFASLILDDKDKEANKGAVQVPDPFLKNVIIRASYAVFEQARHQGVEIGYKDCGAGGIMCATSELGDAGGYGIEIDLNKVHVSMASLPSYVIACSETQERLVFISPPKFTSTILRIFNEDFNLPNVAEKAMASIIGKVREDKRYVIRHNNKTVCDADTEVICKGIRYNRDYIISNRDFSDPVLSEPDDYNEALLDVLRLPQIASKAVCYEHYDTDVQGNTIIKPGMADAGVINPVGKYGVALSVDCNPKYSRINPYLGAVNAVAESMRNIAAVGATPIGLSDCLNYGNPEKPEQFWQFKEGVRGLSDATRGIKLHNNTEPIPFVSGNVSFYNESSSGKSIDASAIVACVGIMDDCNKAITTKIKKAESILCIVGQRKDELGGSAYYEANGLIGKNVPQINFSLEHGMIYGIIECIDAGILLSCHDISDGGLIVAICEMILGGKADGIIGANILLNDNLRTDALLFSETSGFVFEIDKSDYNKAERIFAKYNVEIFLVGHTTPYQMLSVTHNDKEVISLSISQIAEPWLNGFEEALR